MNEQKSFQEGWNFNARLMGAHVGGARANEYVASVDVAIHNLQLELEAQGTNNLPVAQLKGILAEYWHANSFNVEAALRASADRAIVEGSHEYASADVTTYFGKSYSMKYYATGKESAIHEAKNVIQSYYEYLSRSKKSTPMSFDQYISRYGYTNDMNELLVSVYKGQGRIIPCDQLSDAIEFLERKIATESAKETPEHIALLNNYKETLQNLTDRISNSEGIESRPLSKEEAEVITELVKEGRFKAEDFGYSLEQMITPEYILSEALKAGYTASVITLVLRIGPEIIKSFEFLLKNGYIDKEQLFKTGAIAVDASVSGFLRGSIAAALTISCKAGKFGNHFTAVTPQTIGALTVIALETLKCSISVATGKMEAREMGSTMAKSILISSAALYGGSLGQMIAPELPVFAYMLGSLVGSTVASIGVGIGERFLLSYCVDSGFTCFGLVKQDYRLPESVLEEMGISVTKVDRILVDRVHVDRIYPDRIEVDRDSTETIQYVYVRRGIIGINRIGYVES